MIQTKEDIVEFWSKDRRLLAASLEEYRIAGIEDCLEVFFPKKYKQLIVMHNGTKG